ncbi:transmembrane protein [Dictyostelium discoideum AX4]|uniref:Transmembrane protein n=1 Tax=Dictyostelium discoideum TaxID=44689 RepID=Q556Y0_DICDI|nr:transmembrane protein [Dictyostelium discoideum AX4]XP_644761.1 transmembrane protein [Dictyostelium discoideum AX4]EAL70563.1 transmembrane protein [Dictyostelium discoideum AX4]EAL70812.1 transmembrane protein [Dictyostelium discoideum AX4]|eukprot:XP_644489.1 transmembrane protein [Dictyostelium discoideum AX4]
MKLLSQFISIIIIFLIIFISVNNSQQQQQEEDIIAEEEPNGIPINLNIILIGFDGNGAFEYNLPPETLNDLLVETYPIHYVHSIFDSNYLKPYNKDDDNNNGNANNNDDIEKDNIGKRLISHYDLKYNVISSNRISLDLYEQLLQINMKPIESATPSHDGETHLVEIEVLESYFDNEITKIKSSSTNSNKDYSIIFINPSKERILTGRALNNNDKTGLGEFKYQYSKNGQITSPCWIGSSRFIVIDLSAGPLKYGTTLHKSSDEYYSEGSIGHDSIPRLIEYFVKDGYSGTSIQGASPIEIISHMSSLVITSIQNVFLQDCKFNYVPLFQKILIPILIFKDSSSVNVQKDLLDLELIKRQSKKVFPFSTVEFVFAEHSIHEHKHISMAFSKSIKSHSSFEMNPTNGKFYSVRKNYLDSKELLLSLKQEDDILASGLIGNDVSQIPLSLKVSNNNNNNKNRNSPTQKSKILPVYIFALTSSSTNNDTNNYNNLLLDKYHSYASNQDAIVVLMSNHTYNSTFYKGNLPVQVNSLYSGTRNIIAGLGSSQGLLGPTLHYSESHNRLVNNFLWSFGSSPWNLFNGRSNDASNAFTGGSGDISQIFIDAIIRNTIITSIQSSEHNLNLALNEITKFSSKYLIDSLGFEIEDISLNKGNFIIDRLYHTPPSKLPILKSIVQRLHNDLEQITNEITNQIKSIPSYLNSKELTSSQKDKISQDLIMVATQVVGFLDYVHKEISNVETQLLCCAITHGNSNKSGGFFGNNLNIIVVVVAIIISAIVIKIANEQISNDKKPLLINRNRNRIRSKINTN